MSQRITNAARERCEQMLSRCMHFSAAEDDLSFFFKPENDHVLIQVRDVKKAGNCASQSPPPRLRVAREQVRKRAGPFVSVSHVSNMDTSVLMVEAPTVGSKFGEILKEVQFAEWSTGYVQYEQIKPLISRVEMIKKEKDEAKTFEVRKSSLADAEEALWLAVEQQVDKADSFYSTLIESLEKQHEIVVGEMHKVKQLQNFLIKHNLYAPSHVALSDLGERIVDGFYGPLTTAAVVEYEKSAGGEPLPEATPDSLVIVADFCSTIDHMQEFILINYVTLSKILKHYVKCCGADSEFQQRLHQKLPNTLLYTTPGLLELMYKAEALVAGDVSVGKARVMEGDAWIESRLVHSSIMALAG